MVNLPFTSAQFFDVFGAYNRSLWVVVLGLWLYVVAAAWVLARFKDRSRFVSIMLAVQWVWAGLAYHAMFFSRINPAAWLFAALFVVQGLLFFQFGVIHQRLRFSPRGSFRHAAAWTLITYGLMYPLIVKFEGHVLPDAPTFGVPCPTTLLTLGFLFAADPPWPRAIAVIPVLWSLVAGSAAILLGVRADLMLWVAGLALGASVLRRCDDHRQDVSPFRSDDRASRSGGLVAR
jgi:uncharacterized protein DUF6064